MALSLEHLDGALREILDATFREHPLQHQLAPTCSAASILGAFHFILGIFITLLPLKYARSRQCLAGPSA
jgi:hypothetical protein